MNTLIEISAFSAIPLAMIVSGIVNGSWKELYNQFKRE